MSMSLRSRILSVLCLLTAACGRTASGDPSEPPTMKPSVTYLHLLRHTPFFTALDTSQLRWTIDHSHEWEAEAGAVVTECASPEGKRDDAYWILLDGGWQVEESGRIHPAGHADPGKWFNAADTSRPCRLVVNQHSYVMKISRADMEEMLSKGFAFDAHLKEGQQYYLKMFGP